MDSIDKKVKLDLLA